jgi:hypothetical protein
MTQLHTVYEFGNISDLLADCSGIFICLLGALIGLAIYFYAKYYIDPENPKVDQFTGRSLKTST